VSATKSERARSFEGVAAEYERGRPGYAPEAIEWLLGPRPLVVVDVGAGTGKLTRALLDAGHEVTAVEPLAGMRSLLAASSPQATVTAGAAEELPIADSYADAIVAGAAFHWFDAARALAEFERVLRPGGTVGLLGNSFDVTVPWVARLRAVLGPPATDRPGHWPEIDELRGRFASVEDGTFAHTQETDLAALRDLALSRSGIAVLAPDEREVELARIGELWRQDPELAGRSSVMLPWLTRVRRCAGLLPAQRS